MCLIHWTQAYGRANIDKETTLNTNTYTVNLNLKQASLEPCCIESNSPWLLDLNGLKQMFCYCSNVQTFIILQEK